MDDFLWMQIHYTRYELPSNLLDWINSEWLSLLHEVNVHIVTTHVFDNYMHFVNFLFFIVLSHEVLVFNDIWVNKVFCHSEFFEHGSEALVCHLCIVLYFSCFVNEISWNTSDRALENLSLCSTFQLLKLPNFQFIFNFLIRTVDYLVIQREIYVFQRLIKLLIKIFLKWHFRLSNILKSFWYFGSR